VGDRYLVFPFLRELGVIRHAPYGFLRLTDNDVSQVAGASFGTS